MRDLQYQLEKSERMYRAVCDTSQNAFLYYRFREDDLKSIGKWDDFFPCRMEKVSDITKLYDMIEPAHILRLRDTVFCEKKGEWSAVCECYLPQKRIWLECDVTVLPNEAEKPEEKIIRFQNITNYKSKNDNLSYLAFYDMLTGLYNRNYFVRNLTEWINRARKEHSLISVLFIDIDDFRKINDGLGILAGDEVLQLFGQYLGSFQNNQIMAAHIDSDIFCLAVYAPTGLRSVEHLCRQIMERLTQPFLMMGRQEIHLSASIGVADYPEAGHGPLELIRHAEIVMFHAKHSGKNTVQYFDPKILDKFLKNVEIDHRLREAAKNLVFNMEFQPQYYCGSKRFRGVEALIRWKDKGKAVSPSVFIPVAEKNGTIIPIGNWVIDECLRIYSGWCRTYGISFILSINISVTQYKRAQFVPNLIHLLEKYQVNPRNLELEITEGVLIEDFEAVAEKLSVLRGYGIKVSIDDFGTGFSSLSYLNGLPVDTLKIDKAFIDRVSEDVPARIMTESIVSMVKKLGFETIAEGVETQDQYEFLTQIHCDVIQGYYLGRPMAEGKISQMLLEMSKDIQKSNSARKEP